MKFKILNAAQIREHMPSLVALLQDSVDSGASVGYLPPLADTEAEAFWREVAADENRIVIAAFDTYLVGAVQLALSSRPNGTHRAEVQKLMVHSQHRGRRIAPELMEWVEEVAAKRGRTLLVLDTRKGDIAEKLYERIGYVRAGEIPGYARSADGEMHTTVFFYKNVGRVL